MLLATVRHLAVNQEHVTHISRVRATLADGSSTTLYVARFALAGTKLVVHRLPGLTRLEGWCQMRGISDALVGGFYRRDPVADPGSTVTGMPLGELRLDGLVQPHVPFSAPWGARRACIHVADGEVRIARRDDLPEDPTGDLLQAGPLLLSGGRVVPGEWEGFSAGADQFDSDITLGRHPRAALGSDGEHLIAVVCDGRAHDEAGLTLDELARALLELGAREALNLDGGGSASLVAGGRLCNVPRESHGLVVLGGRQVATALVFASR